MRVFAWFAAALSVASCGGSFTTEPSPEAGGTAGAQPDASAAGAGGSAGPTGSGGSVTTGGAAGEGGRGGGGGAGGTVVDAGGDSGAIDAGGPACKIDSDCKLVDDCCLGCLAKEASFPVPPCGMTCIVNPCQPLNVKGVRCQNNVCILAAECDSSVITCRSLPPTCPPGEVPSISGNCWSGQCVRASACRTVKDCSACRPELSICVDTQTQLGNQVRCIDVPPGCQTSRTCTCAGAFACMSPFTSCISDAAPGSSHLFCSCPNC